MLTLLLSCSHSFHSLALRPSPLRLSLSPFPGSHSYFSHALYPFSCFPSLHSQDPPPCSLKLSSPPLRLSLPPLSGSPSLSSQALFPSPLKLSFLPLKTLIPFSLKLFIPLLSGSPLSLLRLCLRLLKCSPSLSFQAFRHSSLRFSLTLLSSSLSLFYHALPPSPLRLSLPSHALPPSPLRLSLPFHALSSSPLRFSLSGSSFLFSRALTLYSLMLSLHPSLSYTHSLHSQAFPPSLLSQTLPPYLLRFFFPPLSNSPSLPLLSISLSLYPLTLSLFLLSCSPYLLSQTLPIKLSFLFSCCPLCLVGSPSIPRGVVVKYSKRGRSMQI